VYLGTHHQYDNGFAVVRRRYQASFFGHVLLVATSVGSVGVRRMVETARMLDPTMKGYFVPAATRRPEGAAVPDGR
jgi:hypothetical protein